MKNATHLLTESKGLIRSLFQYLTITSCLILTITCHNNLQAEVPDLPKKGEVLMMLPQGMPSPAIAAAKELTSVELLANDDVRFTFSIVVENTGDTYLDNISVDDPLTFLPGAYPKDQNITVSVVSLGADADPTVSLVYDGEGNINLLSGTDGFLAPGQRFGIILSAETNAVDFRTIAPTPDNQATAFGRPVDSMGVPVDDPTTGMPYVNPVSDLSDDGDDPTTTNPGFPGDTGGADDPTPLYLPANIAVVKSILSFAPSMNKGNYDVLIRYRIQNIGDFDLDIIDLFEAFAVNWGPAFVGISVAPFISNHNIVNISDIPTINPLFDGILNVNILSNDGRLDADLGGRFVEIDLVAEVDASMAPALGLYNQASAQARVVNPLPGDPTGVDDESDDNTASGVTGDAFGDNPLGAGDDGAEGIDDPSPLLIPELGIAKRVSMVEDASSGIEGNFDVTFELVYQNTGTTPLQDLFLVDDIPSLVGPAFVTTVSGPGLVSTTASVTPSIDPLPQILPGTDGVLLPGQNVVIAVEVELDASLMPPFGLINQAFGLATPTDGFGNPIPDTNNPGGDLAIVPDLSDSGTDPTTNNVGAPLIIFDPDPLGCDNPTPMPNLPAIGVAKRVLGYGNAASGIEGNFDVTYEFTIRNNGNTFLENISLIDNFEAQYGGAFVTNVSLALPSNGGPNVAFDGTAANPEMLDQTAILGPGDVMSVIVTIEVSPESPTAILNISGELENQATVSGLPTDGFGGPALDPDGMPLPVVDDLSDSGIDPEGVNPGEPGDTGGFEDPTPFLYPSIKAAKDYLGFSDASSGTIGNLDLSFEITIQNTGLVPLTAISLRDTFDLAEHLGPGYVGLTATGAPMIVASNASINPTINASFDGTAANSNIFDGLSGLLEPGQSLTVGVSIEINPFLVSDSEFLFNQATVSAFDVGVTVTDQSDSGDDPSGTNPDAEGDTGGEDDPTPLDICSDDCDLACKEQVNVSLDQNCETVITVGMVGVGIPEYCEYQYDVVVADSYGNPIPGNMVDVSMVGQNLDFWLTKDGCNNSCEGKVLIEYKLPPQIDCPGDVTLSCGALELMGVPPATGGCAPFEVFLFRETRKALECDSLYTHIIERTYKAVDDLGNESECSHTVYIERVDLSGIFFPDPFSLATGNPVVCSDPLIEFDANGVPVPWPSNPMTASGTGVPIQCDPLITNGLICPATGSGTGVPLIPGENQILCSAIVTYTDIELPEINCVRKIMRTWEVREWWCNGENTVGGIQLIEIIDDEAPEFDCPADFSVTTNDDCAGSVQLPPIDAMDECGHGFEVRIDYPLGFIHGNGGEAELEVGPNTVTYIVNDSCYNTATCTMQVMVSDSTEPVTICDPNTVVSISMQGNTITAAEVYDDGSWDECGLDSFAVRRMDTTCVVADTMFGDFITFCCSDVGQDVMVVFRAVDKGGNYNDCMVSVEVQDKVDPVMTCPDDVTIDCREAYDLNNLGVSFGLPDVIDNCMNLEDVFEIPEADVNQCGIGEITRRFELRNQAGEVLSSCKQFVEIINTAPFVAGNIQWPLDYSVDNLCGLNALRPENLPVNNAFPIYTAGDDECSMLGYDYEDEVFEPQPGTGECAHIERTWRVINWCSQINGVFEVFEKPSPQIIILNNTVAPVLDPMADQLFESGNVDCLSGDIEMVRTATDDCMNELYWSYEIRDTMNNLISVGQNDTIATELPVGHYNIFWNVHDGCGNFDIDTVGVEVRNTKAPSPVCMQGLSVNIDQSMMVSLNAEMVDGGSYHTCNNPIVISLDQDTSIKTLVFECEDVGMQMIQLWVTDTINGAQDYCSTFIDVQDTDSVCPINSGMISVSGEVHTEELEMIEEVTVELSDPDVYRITDDHGYYSFDNMPEGGTYEVIPAKGKDYLNGVSTLDLIIIQRHILGLESLDSPYKLIAADINNNREISAIDLIELRKLILGVYDELPDNSSWRFVDQAYNFPELLNPWLEEFPETYHIPVLEENMFIDFIGVKIGDVNASANVNTMDKKDLYADKQGRNVRFSLMPGEVKAGSVSRIPVYAGKYEEVYGWQTTLQYDPLLFTVLSIEARGLDVGPENYNMALANKGLISMSYHNNQPKSLTGDILFEVVVEAKKDYNTGQAIEFGSELIASEAYNSNGQLMEIRTSEIVPDEFAIVSIQPNPWIDETTIAFELDKAGDVTFEYYDASGRLLSRSIQSYSGGLHYQTVKAQEVKATGVIYVKMITEGTVREEKMLKLK